MRRLGRGLQVLGMVVLPLAIVLELSERLNRVFHVSQMVYMLVFGLAAFYVGRVIEGYSSIAASPATDESHQARR